MKKKINFILLLILGIMIIGSLSPISSGFFALADNQEPEPEVRYDLVPYNFNSSSFQYGVAEVSTFTPFDKESNKRMDGMSFTFEKDAYRQIVDSSVKTNKVAGLDKSEDYSLILWVYFDKVDMHSDFSLSLTLENDTKITWNMTTASLKQMVITSYPDTLSNVPLSWVKLELPIKQATAGDYEGTEISPIVGFSVNYSTTAPKDDVDYSTIKFYDLYITKSSNSDKRIADKQNYVIYKFNPIAEQTLKDLIIGDVISLPALKSAVVYAWEGETDLLKDSSSIVWRLTTKDPDSTTTRLSFELARELELAKQGTYTIVYECYNNTNETQDYPTIVYSQSFFVGNANLVYFESSNLSIEIGNTQVLRFKISPLLSGNNEITFTSSSEDLTFEVKDGYVEITPLKKGEYTLKVSVVGAREGKEAQTFTDSINIKAYEQTSNRLLYIAIIGVMLGVIGVVLVVLLIKTLVKKRKIVVK